MSASVQVFFVLLLSASLSASAQQPDAGTVTSTEPGLSPAPESAQPPVSPEAPVADEGALAPAAGADAPLAPPPPEPTLTPDAAPMVAEPPAPPPSAPQEEQRETVIVGTSEARTSGAVHVIKDSKLQRMEYDDPQSVLQTVPGVYARAEDGFGLRPNIGLRGANSDRSKKVTLLEDGVLFGPAPYSAPAAYYFPLMTRMQSVRVLKGPSAIVHGPQTIGGSVDLITRGVPYGDAFAADLAAGTHAYGKAHAYYGSGSEHGGFMLEGVHLRNEGFKEIDGLPDADTGFRRNEWMLKARRRLVGRENHQQTVELKLGYSDERSNETYLGLTDADFAANPNRRYAASRFDRMQWHRTQIAVSHLLESGAFSLTTTAYRHDFDRSWRKVNRFRGASLAEVLGDPQSARNALYYSVLTGQSDSTVSDETLLIGPNHRVFVSQGIQTLARTEATTGPFQHKLELGLRYHFDSADRVHTEDGYRVVSGRLIPEDRGTETTASNHDSTHAVALHAVDAIVWKRFVLTPGLRLELIRSHAVDRLNNTDERGRVEALLPGVGLYAALTQQLGLFTGVYRGFSPPPPGQGDTVTFESSVNYEAGVRWTRPRERLEVVGFFNDYSNLTDICTFASGCLNENLDRQFDAGRARIWGLEAYADKTFQLGPVSVPLTAAYTLTRTRLLESFVSPDPQFDTVQAGDELAYVPRHQLSAGAGVQLRRVGLHFQVNFIDQMREVAGQGEPLPGERTQALLTLDATANVFLWEGAQVYCSARNLLDEQVIVSRRPFGARPNAPRMVQVGFKYAY